MAKTAKNKKYTEDIVLNKILKDISEENTEAPTLSSEDNVGTHSYEDVLIKQYREKDILEKKQKYIHIVKIIAIVSIFIFLILVITYYMDSTHAKQTQAKKIITPTPITQEKVKEVSKPKNIETIKEEPKEVIPEPIKEPIKIEEVKTERELAKEMLLKEMKN